MIQYNAVPLQQKKANRKQTAEKIPVLAMVLLASQFQIFVMMLLVSATFFELKPLLIFISQHWQNIYIQMILFPSSQFGDFNTGLK